MLEKLRADSRPARSSGSGKTWWRRVSPILVGAAMVLGAFLLYRTLARYEPSELISSIAAASPARLLLALAFAAASYLCLTGFDWLALRYVGHKLPYRRAALASFTALSLGHNIGFAALSSGAIRYRFYTRWGLEPVEVAKVILFCGVTVGLGLATLGCLVTSLRAGQVAEVLGWTPSAVLVLGAACGALPLGYLGVAAAGWRRLRFRHWTLELPDLRTAALQILLGALNFSLVAACLHQALNAIGDAAYTAVAAVYVIANTAALVSHVPGGLGVIEGTVSYLLSAQGSVAAVLIFRVVYYLVPLAFGLTIFILTELLAKKSDR